MFEHTSRNFPLIGKKEQEILENAVVAVAGVGGIGAWAAEALVRMGIGKIRLADLDLYEIHNLNRQAHSTYENIGKEKVREVERALKKINPNVEIEVFPNGINEGNIDAFLVNANAVIDAVEYFEFEVRRLIQNKSRSRGIPTFLNVVAAFSVGLFIFDSNSMSFDEFIGYSMENKNENEFVMPFERTIPVFPKYMLEYASKDLLKNIKERREPITNLCAPIAIGAFWAANEIILYLLNRRKAVTVPNCLVFDMYTNNCHIVNPIEKPLWSKKEIIERSVLEWD